MQNPFRGYSLVHVLLALRDCARHHSEVQCGLHFHTGNIHPSTENEMTLPSLGVWVCK
jgi:hypothetical protein